ncbi:MAG: carboxypeptidase-like regulatory domain-containing protein [Bacteroidales bacterium]|nr:carboxypeptidase-like regulatory domain-containing protein [Bacteroidales bacterium]
MASRLKTIIIVLLCLYSLNFFGQGSVEGVVSDAISGESLIGVNIVYALGKGVISDINGLYKIELENGSYTLTFSYVGYISQTKEININNNNITINVDLKNITLSEVEIVGDLARSRETPVAFSTITPVQLDEELASQEIPMILNSTPGVYATQQGGGDGDARINIRGFSQNNVAVMIDGLPVNDMENGWVYWSNWFGLDLVTQTIQVQRGLGASKLALPSVGGTMNIITSGIKQKQKIKFKQEVGDKGYLRTSLGYTSGQLKGGWGITFAGSYKRGNGWVDRTFTEGWFYYLKVDKKLGKHIISLTAMGAPQEHGQRRYRKPIATFDSAYASSLGVNKTPDEYFNTLYLDPVSMVDKGLRYNPDWGKYTTNSGEEITLNDKKNYYHKPLFTLRHLWSASDKFYLSNILYLSLGNGGGTATKRSVNPTYITEDGQINFQEYYDINLINFDPEYPDSGPKSYQFLRSNKNNHNWIGLLSTFNYKINDEFTLSGGLDLRRYVGSHYEEVYDLLGGTYMLDTRNSNRNPKDQLIEGDKINYYNDAIVEWAGLFSQLEYKIGNFSAFINLTGAYTGYKKIDYFAPKELKVGDTVLAIGYGKEVEYNGQIYDTNSPGLDWAQSEWKWMPGFTVKGGGNYNLSERSNIFANLGYMSKAPLFRNVYERNTLNLLGNIENEFIKAIELGYSYRSRIFSFNTNTYYTVWENKPGRQVPIPLDDENIGYFNIQGMDALHIGVELDFVVKILDNLKIDGLFSIGNWKYTSADSVRIYDDNNVYKQTEFFNAKGVHVGDAAQTQLGAGLRYEPIKKLYLSGRITFFDRYYSDFNPLNLDPERFPESFDENGNPVDAWKTPSYILVDFHTGYSWNIKKVRFDLRASVLNVFNELYISDARDNDSFSSTTTSHDAMSAGVYMGLGRRFNISLMISL